MFNFLWAGNEEASLPPALAIAAEQQPGADVDVVAARLPWPRRLNTRHSVITKLKISRSSATNRKLLAEQRSAALMKTLCPSRQEHCCNVAFGERGKTLEQIMMVDEVVVSVGRVSECDDSRPLVDMGVRLACRSSCERARTTMH